MAIAFVVSTQAAGPGAVTTPSVDTSGANFLIAYGCDSSPLSVPMDSKSNTWTPLSAYSAAFGADIQFFYVQNATTGSGHTFTFGSAVPFVGVLAFSGVNTSGAFDQESGTPNVGDNPGAITPAESDELFVAGGGDAWASGPPSVTDEFSGNVWILQEWKDLAASVNFSGAVAYYIHTASASHLNPKWTFSSSTTGSFNMACFKQAAGANTDTTWMGRPQRPMANFFPTIVKVP